MQQAANFIESYVFKQNINNGELTYDFKVDKDLHHMNSREIVKNPIDGTKTRIDPSTDPRFRYYAQFDDGQIEGHITKLMEALTTYLDYKESNQLWTIIFYILLTQCYSLFNSIPILWIYSPDPATTHRLRKFMGTVCFNPIDLFPYNQERLIINTIKDNQVTIIITDVAKFNKYILDFLVGHPNTDSRQHYYPSDFSSLGDRRFTPFVLYGPKIIIADKLPPRKNLQFTIAVSIFGDKNPGSDRLTGVDGLRTRLQTVAIKISGRISERLAEYIRSDEPELMVPIMTIASILKEYIPTEGADIDSATEAIRESYNGFNSGFLYCDSREVLFLVRESLQRKQNGGKTVGFVPLEDIVEDLKKHHQELKTMTAKTLSQELNKWPGLVKMKKRELVDIGKQRTCVKIDEDKLNYFLNL